MAASARNLDQSQIGVLLGEIPSDFDTDTDESLLDETEIRVLDPLIIAEDETRNDQEDCVIISGEDA